MRVFRLAFDTYDPLSGEGAGRYGGRWNSSGERLVYASAYLSLAVLETLVHVDDLAQIPRGRHYFEFEVDDAGMETITADDLPEDWRNQQQLTRKIGDDWLHEQRSVALRVPSAVVVLETNVLVNPEHRAFGQSVERLRSGPFSLDPRLKT